MVTHENRATVKNQPTVSRFLSLKKKKWYVKHRKTIQWYGLYRELPAMLGSEIRKHDEIPTEPEPDLVEEEKN